MQLYINKKTEKGDRTSNDLQRTSAACKREMQVELLIEMMVVVRDDAVCVVEGVRWRELLYVDFS